MRYQEFFARLLTPSVAPKSRQALVSATLVLIFFSAILPAFGNTITVTNTGDIGTGSLRDAIANALSGGTINFNLAYPATITLTNFGEIVICKNLTINGPGPSNLV